MKSLTISESTKGKSRSWVSLDAKKESAGGSRPLMQRRVATKPTPAVPGVISTIADGFSMALWRPLIIVVPVLLDFYYLVGWRIEIGAFALRLQQWALAIGVERGDANILRIAQISQWDLSTAPSFFFVPSLLSGANRANFSAHRTRETVSTAHWEYDAAIVAGIFLLSMFLAAIFLNVLGDKALDRRPNAAERIRETGRIWLRLTAVTLVAIAAVALVSGIVLSARIQAGQDIGPVFTVALIVQFFVSLALWFAPDAIVMAHAGAFQAIKLSLGTIRRHFWSSLGFISASVIFGQGMHDLFLRMAGSVPGLVIGVVLYALFSSGLALASFWFFNSRNQQTRSTPNVAGMNSGAVGPFRSKEK